MVLEGQAALVTGGSSGIGQATAVALAEAGADVAINHLGDDAGAKQTADQITALGRRALILEQDVSDQSGMERVVAAGGQVVNGPMEVPGGDTVAQCVDPQGAAFALHGKA